MLFYIMLEPVSELSNLIPLQGKSGSIGMTTEIEQEVAATLDGWVRCQIPLRCVLNL